MAGCSGTGLKGSSSSLMILMSGSGTGALAGSGRAEMVIGKGSSTAGNSHCDRMFEFLQALCIPLSTVSPDGLPVSW